MGNNCKFIKTLKKFGLAPRFSYFKAIFFLFFNYGTENSSKGTVGTYFVKKFFRLDPDPHYKSRWIRIRSVKAAGFGSAKNEAL